MAARGALVYFLVDALSALDRVYHYTMATFVAIMLKGMASMILLQARLTTRHLKSCKNLERARLWHRCVQIPDQ